MNTPLSVHPASFGGVYRGKRVLVTGHTGFKGAWLCEWLLALGADVIGFALPPPTEPSLFEQLQLSHRIRHVIGDVRDSRALTDLVAETRPDFIFHLAAQAIVRLSYEQPVETYATNVMGTVHLLEAVRIAHHACAVVVITTDKCYENKEWTYGYREEDPMGGYDPYSSSKGAAELVISAYRRSFFSSVDSLVRLASARAGNVIGGGDWAVDRIVPDCVRALRRGEPIPVRNKVATRPWQHVLEPLSGYLWLAACLVQPELTRLSRQRSNLVTQLAGPFNFGPTATSDRSVLDLVQEILEQWPGEWVDRSDPHAVHEASLLKLSTDKAAYFLGWRPVWGFQQTVARTITWYRDTGDRPEDSRALTQRQIEGYTATAQAQAVAWACMPQNG